MKGWALLACLAGLALPSVARADSAQCIASNEHELALRKQQKLRDALKELVACAAPECPAEIRTECNRRLTELNLALPTVVLGATDAAGNDLSAVKVTMDGVPLTSSLDGRAVTVDPGSHVLKFEAPGQAAVEKTVVIAEGVKDRHVTVVLGGPAAPPIVVPTAPPPASTPPPTSAPSTSSSSGGGVRTAGIAVGVVGVAGVVVASVVGAMAVSKASVAKNECTPSNSGCQGNTTPQAESDMQTASTYANISTGAFAGGGALVAAGVVMIVLGGPKTTTTGWRWTPSLLAHGGGGMMLSGSF